MRTPERYVFDTSAWLTLIEDEEGADEVQLLLEKAKTGECIIFTSFMSFMEMYYITCQERGVAEAQMRLDLISALPVIRAESTVPLAVLAAEIKASYRLSVADAWIAALAEEQDAHLVHKDPEFEPLVGRVQLSPLPYKS